MTPEGKWDDAQRLAELSELATEWVGILGEGNVQDAERFMRKIEHNVRSHDEDRSLKDKVRSWVEDYDGVFRKGDIYRDIHPYTQGDTETTRRNLQNISIILQRLKGDGVVEHLGSGKWRKIDAEIELMDYVNAPSEEFDVALPFDLNDAARIFPKNIIVVAGDSDSGKTSLLLELARLNMRKRDVYYFCSDMGSVEMKERMIKQFPDIDIEDWPGFFPIERSADWHDVIRKNEINIIDYMELCEGTYIVGEYIKRIWDKLDKGIAVVAIQKQSGRDLGRGGGFTIEKARLYVSMGNGRMKLMKCKNSRGNSMKGWTRDYKVTDSGVITPMCMWGPPRYY